MSWIDGEGKKLQQMCGAGRYQQEGINWLAFLRRFSLHGVLCDDMGLGKTLQVGGCRGL